ncbi:hypothetical protein FQN54_009834 [Arachnomyces sp. PD_36]|nr:hypothetical protein FQN54_009834 [Arachnomyces sp. PD_36]
MSTDRRTIYRNQAPKTSLPPFQGASLVKSFHESLPAYAPTPLVPLEDLAKELGVKGIFVKDESTRLGLPSFKILGASWGTYRAITAHLKLGQDTDLTVLSDEARKHSVRLLAATDGNHGRAIARMGQLLKLPVDIFVPYDLDEYTRNLIASEGATVTVVEGDYDAAILRANQKSSSLENSLLIQDTAFEGYEEIPSWIVEGYSTMLHEIDSQLASYNIKPTTIITPAGVGSLSHAVVSHSKSEDRNITVLTVEPDTAACLHKSLKLGTSTPLQTSKTIMSGLNCGTVSSTAWPILHSGVDASTTISDYESDQAVKYLSSHGLSAGPCGSAALAALTHVASTDPSAINLSPDSVIVLLCTEGRRPYYPPVDVSSSDPVQVTKALNQANSLDANTPKEVTARRDYITAWLQHRDLGIEELEAMPGYPSPQRAPGLAPECAVSESYTLAACMTTLLRAKRERDASSSS